MPQCETTGAVQPMRSRDFIICAPGGAFTTRMMASAPAFFRRVSCGTMSTSLFSNFSMPTISMASFPASAATRPFSFDSPQGLLISMRPAFFAPNFLLA